MVEKVQVIWRRVADREFHLAIAQGKEDFGEAVSARFTYSIIDQASLLSENPQMGQRRPELDTPRRQMRSLLVHEHFQLIYYYHESKATVYIVSLWDTRKNPVSLRSHIRR